MKPSAFDYLRPGNLEEALAALALNPDDTKILAGGQSLVPMMNFRLARPARLIDINRIAGLEGIHVEDARVRLAARTRHVALQTCGEAGPVGHLLRSAATHIGHLPIRTRGTFGGSLAHADAASEWCLVAAVLEAEITVCSEARGSRTIRAAEFFKSLFTTAVEPDEILVEVSLPLLDDNWCTGIAEYARRAGDFGIVIVTAAIQIVDGVVADARVAIGGVSDAPFRSAGAEALLLGQPWTNDLVTAAAEAAAMEVEPPSDVHADAAYRRDLVRALLPRALPTALPT